ncbi:MAG: transposase [bacterium]
MADTAQEQISTTDPDSRKLAVRQNILEVCYNIQASVDDKHNLPIDFKTTNNNDTHALANMVTRVKVILGNIEFVELADKGYHTGEEIRKCHEAGIETLVAIPKTPVSSQAPDPAYNQDQFQYDKEHDYYLCTKSEKGRVIERNETIEATQRNKQAIENNKELYKRRQEIVEHPFGTIKRQ